MTTVIVGGVTLCVLVSLLSYWSQVHTIVKVLSLSAALLLLHSTLTLYKEMLAAPIENTPPDGFIYVHHITTSETITVWVWVEDRGHRLYEIPYDRKTAESMQEAQEQTAAGNMQEGHPVDGGGTGDSNSIDFEPWKPDTIIDTK